MAYGSSLCILVAWIFCGCLFAWLYFSILCQSLLLMWALFSSTSMSLIWHKQALNPAMSPPLWPCMAVMWNHSTLKQSHTVYILCLYFRLSLDGVERHPWKHTLLCLWMSLKHHSWIMLTWMSVSTKFKELCVLISTLQWLSFLFPCTECFGPFLLM